MYMRVCVSQRAACAQSASTNLPFSGNGSDGRPFCPFDVDSVVPANDADGMGSAGALGCCVIAATSKLP